jgi:hypothetical protein
MFRRETMPVDRYTKGVLTVIAGCLLWLCAAGLPSAAHAQQPATLSNNTGAAVPVVIVGTGTITRGGALTVMFRGDRSDPTVPVTLPYTPANPLPTQLPYSDTMPMPTELNSVRKGAHWEPLRVSVEDSALRSKPGIGRGQH